MAVQPLRRRRHPDGGDGAEHPRLRLRCGAAPR
jgi:hypothetical protein